MVARAERGERAVLCRETERKERGTGSSEITKRKETAAHCEIKMKKENLKQQEIIRDGVIMFDHEKIREQETTEDRAIRIHKEDAQHDTNRTKEDSAYPRVMGQMSERRNEKGVLRASGTVIKSPIGSTLEENLWRTIADILEGEESTQLQYGHKTPEVKGSIVIGPPKELIPWRQVNRLSEWKKIGGDKLVSCGIRVRWKCPQSPISLEERKHKQEFSRTTEMTNNYLSLLEEVLKDGVVKSIQESEVKLFNLTFMVIKKNGKWRKILDCRALNEEVQGKAFQDGFPGDSGGTPRGEQLDDHS
ncbi:uncharacterized protein MONOS_15537 [Monocercomonoides exilis]|uniref:uncharacterized protein n=1 Tax=Monocercomonoides exilis TaxID=2049356 RepID=UPI00355AC1AC|nr:hypothetical protein MONOS_15537 [Monocercomonoides exilis]|eukprot:MONOS_15537.1-p1 / transcript=MONOS_15537.1 / gene=MONOS_15537 / organism=Monocercomonoides_exilis_PA203 / gene_product=unspecified product / transcript_product=unspecified product / location=Mono_scaffold01265:10261-11172(-) / protein_length=304 / sequence_SO=supercontig / SO=protein_coding / is_pseudo=false